MMLYRKISICVLLTIGFAILLPITASAQKIEIRSAKIYIRETPPQWDKAMAQLEIAMEKDPGNNEVHYLLGSVHLASGNFEEFITNWETVIFEELGKNEKIVFMDRLSSLISGNSNSGTQSFNNKEFAEAAEFYKRIFDVAKIQRVAYQSTGKKDDAEKAEIAEQAEKTGLLNWGFSIYNTGDLENAANLLERYVEIDPQNPDVWDTLMRIHYTSENWEKSIIACNTIIDLADETDLNTYMLLAGAYFGVADTTNIIETYERAIESFPGERKLYLDISYLHESRNNFDGMIDVLERGHSAHPDDIVLLLDLGKTYYNKGLSLGETGGNDVASMTLRKAINTVNKLLELEPDSFEGIDVLSNAYLGLAELEPDEIKKQELMTKVEELRNKKYDILKSDGL